MSENDAKHERMGLYYLRDSLVLAKVSEEKFFRLCECGPNNERSIHFYEQEQACARTSILMSFMYLESLTNYICNYMEIKSNNNTLEDKIKKMCEKTKSDDFDDNFRKFIVALRIYRNNLVHDSALPIGMNSWFKEKLPKNETNDTYPNDLKCELPEERNKIKSKHAICVIREINGLLNNLIPRFGLSPEEVSTIIFSDTKEVNFNIDDNSKMTSEIMFPLFSHELHDWAKEQGIFINYVRCFRVN
nr:hypothetical protein [uncultured Ottowia sp.]